MFSIVVDFLTCSLKMPLCDTEAIVLRSYKLGEKDKIVNFFTRDFGRIRGVAGGGRKINNQFGGSLEPLTYLRIWFYQRENRNLVRLNSIDLIESFMSVQEEYSGQLAAQYVAEVCDNFMPEEQPDDRVFRLILHVLRGLNHLDCLDAVLCYFSAWILRLGGVLGDLDYCSCCGNRLGARISYYGNFWEGLSCGDCQKGQGRQLGSDIRELCKVTQGKTLDQWCQLGPKAEQSKSLRLFLDEQIEKHIERKLITKQLLNEVKCL